MMLKRHPGFQNAIFSNKAIATSEKEKCVEVVSLTLPTSCDFEASSFVAVKGEHANNDALWIGETDHAITDRQISFFQSMFTCMQLVTTVPNFKVAIIHRTFHSIRVQKV